MLDHDGSRLVVHWVRLARSNLADDAEIGDHYMRVGNGFRRVNMSDAKLAEYKRMLAVRASRPHRPPPASIEEAYQGSAELFAAMGEQR
jgi:hypothetical protein